MKNFVTGKSRSLHFNSFQPNKVIGRFEIVTVDTQDKWLFIEINFKTILKLDSEQ